MVKIKFFWPAVISFYSGKKYCQFEIERLAGFKIWESQSVTSMEWFVNGLFKLDPTSSPLTLHFLNSIDYRCIQNTHSHFRIFSVFVNALWVRKKKKISKYIPLRIVTSLIFDNYYLNISSNSKRARTFFLKIKF